MRKNKKGAELSVSDCEKQAVIFDFDGTLADTFSLFMELAYEITGHERLPQKEVNRLKSMTPPQISKEVGVPLWKVPSIIARGLPKVSKRSGEIKMFHEMPGVLRQLSQDYKIFVLSSNTKKTINSVLGRYGALENIDQVYGGISVFNKHHKLKQIIKRQELVKARTWYVGDEVRDIQAAKKEGIKCIAVSWGYNSAVGLKKHNPAKVVYSGKEIINCINNYTSKPQRDKTRQGKGVKPLILKSKASQKS